MSSQLDSSRMPLSGEGYLDGAHWTFYEGNYPMPVDDSTVAQRLVVKWPDGLISASESVNRGLGQADSFSVLVVARDDHVDGGGGPGAVVVTFNHAASGVELGWSDGTATSVVGLPCPATSHRFAVSALPVGETHANVRLVDPAGATITEKTVAL